MHERTGVTGIPKLSEDHPSRLAAKDCARPEVDNRATQSDGGERILLAQGTGLGRSLVLGLSFWVDQLASGATDEQVIAGIVGSAEYYSDATGT